MIDNKNNISQIENTIYSKEQKDKSTLSQNMTFYSSLNETYSLQRNFSKKGVSYLEGQNIDENDSDDEYELSDELRQEIEKRVDLQFQDKYKEMSEYYEEKIFNLLNEQEKVFTKSEMIKAKINTLENYLKNYCKINGIDFDELVSESI